MDVDVLVYIIIPEMYMDIRTWTCMYMFVIIQRFAEFLQLPKSEKRHCTCAALERSKEKLERLAFRFLGVARTLQTAVPRTELTSHVHACTYTWTCTYIYMDMHVYECISITRNSGPMEVVCLPAHWLVVGSTFPPQSHSR